MKKYRIFASISDSGIPKIECQKLSFLFNSWNTIKIGSSGNPAIFYTLKGARGFLKGKEYYEEMGYGLADKIHKIEKQEILDGRYIRMARIWAENSYCKRRKVGALIVKDDSIISDGYNGTPSGFENECECDGKTKQYVLHAEANAITKLAKDTRSSIGATLYITMSPCIECAKLIIQAGIKRVVYDERYRDTSGIDLLRRAGVKVSGMRELQVFKVLSVEDVESDDGDEKEKICYIRFSDEIRETPCRLSTRFGGVTIDVEKPSAQIKYNIYEYVCFIDQDVDEEKLKSLIFKITG